MPQYRIEWSLQGNSTIEAADEKEARRKILFDTPDEKIYADITGMDISDISLDDGGDA